MYHKMGRKDPLATVPYSLTITQRTPSARVRMYFVLPQERSLHDRVRDMYMYAEVSVILESGARARRRPRLPLPLRAPVPLPLPTPVPASLTAVWFDGANVWRRPSHIHSLIGSIWYY
jgi:hypothetical protein